MSRCLSKEKQMEKSESFRDVKGVCDIIEDGHGGFTMDSVYFNQHGGEKYVTSIFRLKSEVDSDEEEWEEVCKDAWKNEEKGKWKPGNFDFKAAIGGSPSRDRSQKGAPEKIKEAHYLKKTGSKRNRKRTSQVKKHLDESFEDTQSDILKEVTNILDEGGFEYLNKCLQEKHGVKCDCSLYVKEVADFYNSQGISLFSDPNTDVKREVAQIETKEREDNEKACEDYVKNTTSFCESLNFPDVLTFEEMVEDKIEEEHMVEVKDGEMEESKC